MDIALFIFGLASFAVLVYFSAIKSLIHLISPLQEDDRIPYQAIYLAVNSLPLFFGGIYAVVRHSEEVSFFSLYSPILQVVLGLNILFVLFSTAFRKD